MMVGVLIFLKLYLGPVTAPVPFALENTALSWLNFGNPRIYSLMILIHTTCGMDCRRTR